MSVVDPLRAGGDRLFGSLVGGGEVWDARALDRRVEERAAAIRGDRSAEPRQVETVVPLGAEPTVVPFVAEPAVESVLELLALWRVGAVPVPLNAALTEAERDDARRRLEGVRLPPATQVVLWTSGTSGRPRGVALSWANLEASARASAERLELGPTDVWVASLSLAHVGGLALVTRALILGGSLVVPDRPGIARLSEILDGDVVPTPKAPSGEYDVPPPKARAGGYHLVPHQLVPTHLSLVPTQLLRLIEHRGDRGPPGNLRCVLVGGAHAPASLVARALGDGWPVALTYGATEMTSQIATAPPALVRAAPGTVGPPLPGVDVRVDASGELWARGPTRALGYVGATEAALPHRLDRDRGGAGPQPALADEGGWYRTGDLGRLDDEGRLWITGRRIDRIVSGGVTVDALEVEESLRAHPSVLDACVVGVPDPEWGERVAAWIEPVVGELDLEELERHLRERLSPAKLPRWWRTVGPLPRNANGKVDRSAVRGALSRGRTPPEGG